MAKQFGGFTPEQLGKIDPAMAGMQADEQVKYMAANPGVSSRVGNMAQQAKKRISMANGGVVKAATGLLMAGSDRDFRSSDGRSWSSRKKMNEHEAKLVAGTKVSLYDTPEDIAAKQAAAIAAAPDGTPAPVTPGVDTPPPGNGPPPIYTAPSGPPTVTAPPPGTQEAFDAAKARLTSAKALYTQYDNQLNSMAELDPARVALVAKMNQQKSLITQATNNFNDAEENYKRQNLKSAEEATAIIQQNPSANIVKGDVQKVSSTDVEKGKISEGTGDAGGAYSARVTSATAAGDISKATEYDATRMTAKEAAEEVQKVMDTLSAATGKPSNEALANAATMTPDELAQLGLTVEQIENAQRVQAPDKLVATEDQLVSGPTVDFERARLETNFTAATGVPSTEATVQGQLTSLMADFEGGNPPAWAAGSMRAATATMAARGLAASSMAGQAIIQAAMESALPIAMQDAQTVASFEAQNLSNRQQSAMFAAEQRAKFLGMEFDQAFQVRVQRAGRIADVANMNFSAEQQVALENARMAQTVDITNLTAKNAKVMADAAAMSQLDLTNLNNRQQANVQRASSFLQFDMKGLDNQQQVAMFKAQSVASALLSDTSAINAERQFNASSDNQVDMFFSNLQTQIDTFNSTQADAMQQFNAGETNALAQFNTAQFNARDQFNTQNALVISQSNAVWDQAVVTQETAAQNEMNRLAAQAANKQASDAYAATMAQARDDATHAHNVSENALQREHAIVLQELANDGASSAAKGTAVGTIVAKAVEVLAPKLSF